MKSQKDEDLRELASSFELHRNQLEQLMRQEEVVRISLEENMKAKETMIRFRESKLDAEILIPIGANIFLYGKLGNRDKVIVGIGSDVAVEDTIDEALKKVEERIDELSDARDKIVQKQSELNTKINEISAKIQQAYEESGQPMPSAF
jgi:prefoldin alpha subunit